MNDTVKRLMVLAANYADAQEGFGKSELTLAQRDNTRRILEVALTRLFAEPCPDCTRKAAPAAVTGPIEAVAYLDIGTGGYLDLGTDLADEALSRLPKGRHALVIAGTYGIDGYVATANPAGVLELLDRLEAAEKDAARYRHLFSGDKVYTQFREAYDFWDGCGGKDGFDSVVDSAIRGDL